MTSVICENVQRYLMMVISEQSPIRKQDAVYVVSAVASTPLGISLAWDWMRTHWDALVVQQVKRATR